jgi:predicted metalloprotease with PDZ domain
VSYYTKGAIVAWCLDLLILARSDGRNSLDTVMRALFADFVTSGPGQSRELIERAVADAAGCALDAEIAVLVDGVEDPPIQEWLADFGLELKSPSGSERATLAIKTRTEDGRLLVDSVPRGSAGWAIGLSPGDEVVAIDGERVLPAEWQPMLEEQLQPGQEITLQLFRRGLLTTVSGRLGAAPEGSWKLIEGSGRLPFRTTKRP